MKTKSRFFQGMECTIFNTTSLVLASTPKNVCTIEICLLSKGFNVTTVVRQGYVLSPKLFYVCIDGLSHITNNSTTCGSSCGI